MRSSSLARSWSAIAGLVLLPGLVVTGSPTSPSAPGAAPPDAGHVTAPRVFAEGAVSTEDDESNGAFSADGSEYFFNKVNPYTTGPRWSILCVSRYRGDKWAEPQVLPFSGKNFDATPRLSPDGKRMYFTSSRPVPGKTVRTLRIWTVDRTQTGWAEPQPLPAPVNAGDNDENVSASVTRDGTLYFASTRDGSGHAHVYRSRFVNGAFAEPEKLGAGINSEFNDSDPYVSPDETLLVFSSTGDGPPTDKDRPETMKGGGVLYPRGDLYASVGHGGAWSPAVHLEHGVNTFADESSPSFSPNGRYLYFTSERSPFSIPTSHRMSALDIETALHATLNGHGNVFFVSIDALDLPRAKGAR